MAWFIITLIENSFYICHFYILYFAISLSIFSITPEISKISGGIHQEKFCQKALLFIFVGYLENVDWIGRAAICRKCLND